jgi:hypothetical protein
MIQIFRRFKSIPVKKEKLDSRYGMLKSMLYSDNEYDPVQLRTRYKPTKYTDSPIKGIEISPSGTEFKVLNQDELNRDMVEREWYLFQHKKAQEFLKVQKRKYEAIRSAMNALEKKDKKLFEAALVKDEKFQFFPTTMRIPTETPPTLGWDYEMDRNK